MSNFDTHELEVLNAFEGGRRKPIATKRELDRLKAAAKEIATNDRQVKIHLPFLYLCDMKIKTMHIKLP